MRDRVDITYTRELAATKQATAQEETKYTELTTQLERRAAFNMHIATHGRNCTCLWGSTITMEGGKA